jgi:hypothetical protein
MTDVNLALTSTLAEELILLATAVAFCQAWSSVRLANATRMVHCDMMNESTNLQHAGVMRGAGAKRNNMVFGFRSG